MKGKMLKRLLTAAIAGVMLCSSLPVYAETLGNARYSESEYTDDLKFLTYCDLDTLREWDNTLGYFDESQAQEIKEYMDTNIINGETSDYKKAEVIYEWIAKNIIYAWDHNTWISADPYEVFTDRTGVCGGYSNLYKAMLNLADIPSVVVVGNTPYGSHAWNAVYADNRWFFVDSTWGASGAGNYFDTGISNFVSEHTTIRLEGASAVTEDGLIMGYDTGISVIGVEDGVTSVNIPETFGELDVTSVSYKLFNQTYGVKTINISSSITYIDTQTYSSTLESINVDDANQIYASKDGVLFTKDLSQVLIYPENKKSETFTLPKETVSFDVKETFSNPYLKNLEVEEGNESYSSYDGALYNKDQSELVLVPAGKEEIRIPADAAISDMAFINADTSKLTIYSEENSPAHQYAQANNIAFAVVSSDTVEIKFEDVADGTWYYDAVKWAVENEITSGYNEKEFGTNDSCTRAQIVTFLWRAMGQPSATAEVTFEDVQEGQYYYEAVQWAVENGITSGYNEKEFGTNDSCTRGQIVTFLWRAKDEPSATAEVTFEDVQEGQYYYEAVQWAAENGITAGHSGNSFAPELSCTRSEVVTFLYRAR